MNTTFMVADWMGNTATVTMPSNVAKCVIISLRNQFPTENIWKHFNNVLLQLVGDLDWCQSSGTNYTARIFQVRDSYVHYVASFR